MPLVIRLKKDSRLAALNLAAHLASGLLLGYVQLPWPLTLSFLFAVVASYRWCARMHVTRTHPRAVVCLMLEPDDSWTLFRRDGQILDNMRIVSCWHNGDSVLARFSQSAWGGCSVIVTAGSTDSDCLRRLRLILLH